MNNILFAAKSNGTTVYGVNAAIVNGSIVIGDQIIKVKEGKKS